MSDPAPTLDEVRRLLTEKMDALDVAWEDDLDDLWKFTPTEQAREVARKADDFYSAYWQVVRAVLPKDSSLDKMREAASEAADDARTVVMDSWAMVLGRKIDRVEVVLESRRDTRASLVKAKQALRDAKGAQTKADRCSSKDDYTNAILEYRKSMGLIYQCEDELDEARRQAGLIDSDVRSKKAAIKISMGQLAVAVGVAIIATIVAVSKLDCGGLRLPWAPGVEVNEKAQVDTCTGQ